MNDKQRAALIDLCERYDVEFNENDYHPEFDLPADYVAGWIGGSLAGRLYVGVSSDGQVSS